MSIVVYRPDMKLLAATLRSFQQAWIAARTARLLQATICLVDNGGLPADVAVLDELQRAGIPCKTIAGHGNVGYGVGHNLAIVAVSSDYHLVLNPDVEMDQDALLRALEFLEDHPDAGLLAPRIDDGDGHLLYLCRRYPTLLDLFVRGFLPGRVRRLFDRRLGHYEMRDAINGCDVVWDPPIVSGCFMLFRTTVLKKLGGFDARYFLYFEDYDLSLRVHRAARVVYSPMVRVLHHGGGAARKGWAHIWMFAVSAVKFYHRFGWKWL